MTIESDIKNVQYFLDGAGDWTIEGDCVCEDICVVIGHADTEAEALTVKRAFEQVLLPRFTRDEAIAIVKEARERHNIEDSFALPEERAERDTGIRLALEALAAAGVFSDGRNMADKLDAAGIK